MRKAIVVLAVLALAAAAVATFASAGSRPVAPAKTHASSQATAAAVVDAIAKARLGTAKYVTDLDAAKADGYAVITKMIPDMGWHFLNSKITGFNPSKPPILVYEKRGSTWQLGAVEWVFPAKPKTPPLPGARYGLFPAACHYADGSFVPAASQDACATTAPGSGAAFTFWHPNLVTFHLWIWYPNPSGVFSGTNPLVHPFNAG
jgi:hypothetical protein